MAVADFKAKLISIAEADGILKFGRFELKSKRVSPYFFNCGLFLEHGRASTALSDAYAHTINEYKKQHPDFDFDVLFGPAYKGIPFAAGTQNALHRIAPDLDVAVSFNRKEVKDHGEGGLLVGASIKGKRVVIIDDVITAGTAIREAISIIASQGGTLVGIIVAINRQEKVTSQSEKDGKGDDGSSRGSAIDEVVREHGVPVMSVLTLDDVIEAMKAKGRTEEVKQMEEYRKQYGANKRAQ